MYGHKSHFWTPRPAGRSWGQLRPEKVAQPAAGADWKYVTPAGFVTRLVSLRALLTASAQVAERRVRVILTDTNNIYYREHSPEVLKAGETLDVNIGQGGSYSPPAKTRSSGEWELPEFLIPAGWEVKVETVNLQTEDQWSSIAVLTEQFEECPDEDQYVAHKLIEKLQRIQEALRHGA